MLYTQTVKIPADRRIVIDLPNEIPAGEVTLTFSSAPADRKKAEARDLELINLHAESLNREMAEMLSFM
ncbi:MAG: hypothetical protein LBG72_09710 [Spirochaetaceae bacterium]|jgi:hypothetical protein|nr:hypothetical protein [Spirochaetaceae bacterium]